MSFQSKPVTWAGRSRCKTWPNSSSPRSLNNELACRLEDSTVLTALDPTGAYLYAIYGGCSGHYAPLDAFSFKMVKGVPLRDRRYQRLHASKCRAGVFDYNWTGGHLRSSTEWQHAIMG